MAENRGRGKPKRWKNENEFLQDWNAYCNYIVENDFCVVPTMTDFAMWLEKNGFGADRRTIYNAIHEYFPGVKNKIENMRSDLVVQGAALGKYPSTAMCIFALKNWCGWTDKQETKSDNNTKIEIVLPETVDEYAN